MKIRTQIKQAREEKGWTVRELAELSGYKNRPATISEIENGKGNPTLDKLERIASALDITISITGSCK